MALNTEDLQRVLNQAHSKLTGVTLSGLRASLFDVFTEFFRDSSSWIEHIVVAVAPPTTEYVLTPVEGGQIIRLLAVYDPNGTGQSAIMPTPGTAVLQHAPNFAQNYTFVVAKNVIMPMSADMIPIAPASVLQFYPGVILDGILGRLSMEHNKVWSDPNLSSYHLQRFRDGIQVAKVATLRANTFGSQRWVYPQSWRTRGQRGGVSVGNPVVF